MIERSLAHPKRTVRADHVLCEEISELTGIEYWVLVSAFAGQQRNVALDVVKMTVAENRRGTPEDWQECVLDWAKKNCSGVYRPGYWDGYELTYEHNEYLRNIGRL